MKLTVQREELAVGGGRGGPGLIGQVADAAEAPLCGGHAVENAGGDGAEECGPQGAGLFRGGDHQRHIEHIGIDLHQQGALHGQSSAGDDLFDGNAVLADAVDDHARAKGGRLDQRAVDFRRRGVERLSQQQPREARIGEDIAVAVVPVEREQAAAERQRRATVTRADGEKAAAILEAEGRLEASRRDAEAKVVLAQASQEAIEKVTSAIQGNELPVMYLLGDKYVDSIKEMSQGENAKIVLLPGDIPAAVRGIMGGLSK